MITIIDYCLGNLASIQNALNRLGIENRISSEPAVIQKSQALILPGVGAAGEGMRNLKQLGLVEVVKEEISKGKPLLGICLGMQLLLSYSEEGEVECLNVSKGKKSASLILA